MARGGHKNCGAQQWCAHLGPLVCEHHAAMWAGADPRELDDPAASQGHGRLTRCGTHCPAALAPTCACVPRPCAGAVGAVCECRRRGAGVQDSGVRTGRSQPRRWGIISHHNVIVWLGESQNAMRIV